MGWLSSVVKPVLNYVGVDSVINIEDGGGGGGGKGGKARGWAPPPGYDINKRAAYGVGDTFQQVIGSQKRVTDLLKNLSNTGATEADLAAVLKPLQQQMAELDGSQGLLNGLTSQITKSALGSTSGASMSAVNAARLSGDGRFGSGGNAAVLAGRAATDAAVNSSSAIANALVQGRLGEANYQQGIMQQKTGLASVLSKVLQDQADFKEGRARLAIEQENVNQQAYTAYGQIAGGVRQAERSAQISGKASKDAAWINLTGNVVQALASN